MRFTVATVLAFAASAMAAVGVDAVEGFDAINTPAEGEKVPAGKPYVVKWDKPKAPYTDGKVFIQVLGGKDPNTLQVREEKVASKSCCFLSPSVAICRHLSPCAARADTAS